MQGCRGQEEPQLSLDNCEVSNRMSKGIRESSCDVEHRMRGEKAGAMPRPDPAPDELVSQDTRNNINDKASHWCGEKMPRMLEDSQGMLIKHNDGMSLTTRNVDCNNPQSIMSKDKMKLESWENYQHHRLTNWPAA